MLDLRKNKKGISIIGTIFTLIILGIMGASLVSLVATDQESRMRSIMRERAFYAVQAGFEYALREIKEGGYPIVSAKTLGAANFTSSIDQSTRRITLSGVSGDAQRTHSITTAQLARDCLTINISGAFAGGTNNTQLRGLQLNRTCLNAVNIDKVTASWTPNLFENVVKVSIGGSLVYNDAIGESSGVAIDSTDHKISAASEPVDYIEFTSGIVGKRITITLTFTDSSTVTSAEIQL